MAGKEEAAADSRAQGQCHEAQKCGCGELLMHRTASNEQPAALLVGEEWPGGYDTVGARRPIEGMVVIGGVGC